MRGSSGGGHWSVHFKFQKYWTHAWTSRALPRGRLQNRSTIRGRQFAATLATSSSMYVALKYSMCFACTSEFDDALSRRFESVHTMVLSLPIPRLPSCCVRVADAVSSFLPSLCPFSFCMSISPFPHSNSSNSSTIHHPINRFAKQTLVVKNLAPKDEGVHLRIRSILEVPIGIGTFIMRRASVSSMVVKLQLLLLLAVCFQYLTRSSLGRDSLLTPMWMSERPSFAREWPHSSVVTGQASIKSARHIAKGASCRKRFGWRTIIHVWWTFSYWAK